MNTTKREPSQKGEINIAAFFILVIILILPSCIPSLNDIEKQVAEDAVKEYNITKEHGSPIDAYVHAGLVAAAYLQANDQDNYKKWKEIEAKEAKNCGMQDIY